MNTRDLFRDRLLQLKESIKPVDTVELIARHGQDGRQMIEHPACNATLARIRAARRDSDWTSMDWPLRNWPRT